MRRYMWPNSCIPSATVLIDAANASSQGRFTLEGVENHSARVFIFFQLFHRIMITDYRDL